MLERGNDFADFLKTYDQQNAEDAEDKTGSYIICSFLKSFFDFITLFFIVAQRRQGHINSLYSLNPLSCDVIKCYCCLLGLMSFLYLIIFFLVSDIENREEKDGDFIFHASSGI